MKQWTKALRSGKYTQTTHRLKSKASYCCLGVLCEIYGEEHDVQFSPSKYSDHTFTFLGETAGIPKEVMRWADIKTNNVSYRDHDSEYQLTYENDSGRTFSQIADMIEEDYRKM